MHASVINAFRYGKKKTFRLFLSKIMNSMEQFQGQSSFIVSETPNQKNEVFSERVGDNATNNIL